MQNIQIKPALLKTLNALKRSTPVFLGVLLLIALITELIPKNFYAKIFTGNAFLDPFLGALFGSIAAGNPLNSYIIGGELQEANISLIAITAFILAWVTVGVIQLPAEMLMLGKRYALLRNLSAFLSAILIAILTWQTLELFA